MKCKIYSYCQLITFLSNIHVFIIILSSVIVNLSLIDRGNLIPNHHLFPKFLISMVTRDCAMYSYVVLLFMTHECLFQCPWEKINWPDQTDWFKVCHLTYQPNFITYQIEDCIYITDQIAECFLFKSLNLTAYSVLSRCWWLDK